MQQWVESDKYQNIVSDKNKSEKYPKARRGDPVHATVAAVFTQSLIFKRCNNQLLCNSMPPFSKIEVLLQNKKGNSVFSVFLSFENVWLYTCQ